jgi:RUN domain
VSLAHRYHLAEPPLSSRAVVGGAAVSGSAAQRSAAHEHHRHALHHLATLRAHVQAWLYASLNASVLAQRLQTLSVLKVLLADWYFPWALLRQEDRLTDFLTELVMVLQPPWTQSPVPNTRCC